MFVGFRREAVNRFQPRLNLRGLGKVPQSSAALKARKIGLSGLEQVAFAKKRAAVFGRENDMYEQTG